MCINSNIFYLPKFLVKAYCAIFFQSRLFTLTWDELLLKSFQWMLHQSLYKAGEYKNIFLVCGLGRWRYVGSGISLVSYESELDGG